MSQCTHRHKKANCLYYICFRIRRWSFLCSISWARFREYQTVGLYIVIRLSFSPQCVQRAPHLSNDVFYLTACYVTIKENKSIINGKSCEYLKNCLQYANNQTKLKTYPNICEYLTNNNTMLISLRSLSFDKGNYRRRDAWCILDQKIMLITKLKPIIESQCTFIDLTTSAASTHLPHTCAICTFRVALCQ